MTPRTIVGFTLHSKISAVLGASDPEFDKDENMQSDPLISFCSCSFFDRLGKDDRFSLSTSAVNSKPL